MLKFKVDENMPAEVAAMLSSAGHDAWTVPQQRLSGKPDPDIATVCQQEGRAIITLDLDFGDIRTYSPGNYSGIIVFRLHQQDKLRILALMQRLLPLLEQEPLVGKLWIVDEATVRVRE